jgi:hypothetical protein
MDIVARLRWSISADTPARYPEIVREAADTIERLRARIAELEAIMIAKQDTGRMSP